MYKRSGDLFAVAPRHAWLILRVSTGFFRLSIACFRHVVCIIYPTQLACGDDLRAMCFAAVSSFFSIPKVTVDRDEVLPPTACKLCV